MGVGATGVGAVGTGSVGTGGVGVGATGVGAVGAGGVGVGATGVRLLSHHTAATVLAVSQAACEVTHPAHDTAPFFDQRIAHWPAAQDLHIASREYHAPSLGGAGVPDGAEYRVGL